MKKNKIYLNEWIQIHPYVAVQASDDYFAELSNRLYERAVLDVPDEYRRKMALYAAAYLEDLVSGLGLWNSFIEEHTKLYGARLPFYEVKGDYFVGEPNLFDLCFIIWNTWQKMMYPHDYIYPMMPEIREQAEKWLPLLEEAYEEAPENEMLTDFFKAPGSEVEADRKLTWLFGHTYLTEPAMLPYIARVETSDRFIVPTGPLALFLYEWIDLLSDNQEWKQVRGLYFKKPSLPASVREKNHEMYQNFTAYTQGRELVYLEGYDELKRFLVEVMKWQDDDNHTLPEMKQFRNFILMINEEKGILLAKDICEYIADTANPMYNQKEAHLHAFRLLTEATLCPPDLLDYCIQKEKLPDAVIPGSENKELIRRNADFIARHSLLYYYRGD